MEPEIISNDAPGSVSTPSPAPAEGVAPAPASPAETPAPQGAPATTEPIAPASGQPTAPADATALVELPDGRKVDTKTAEKEYRTLLADHTRKSQELARFKGGAQPPTSTISPDATKKPWEDPNWVPSSYVEILEVAKQKLAHDAEQERKAKESEDAHLASTIDSQVAELKKTDPALIESDLYKHATKYGFGINLKGAYQNMKDMSASIRKAQEITANNITKRNAEPVNGGSQAVGAIPDGDVYDPNARNMPLSDFLRTLKP